MPAVVRASADAHAGHSGYRVPFHQTHYVGGSGSVFVNNEPRESRIDYKTRQCKIPGLLVKVVVKQDDISSLFRQS